MLELITNNPIFCISTNEIDKKIKELIKVCHYYEFKMPNEIELKTIIDKTFVYENDIIKKAILEYSQYDLRKINVILTIYNKNKSIMYDILNSNCLIKKSIIEISKDIVKTIYKNNIGLDKHHIYVNENDRTIVALLWHENICDVLSNNNLENLNFYYKLLQNMCYGDYIDRITFQKQIWQFNELSSITKIMYNNYLLHNEYDNQKKKSE
jgi:DNA polymerase III delta prime subunit